MLKLGEFFKRKLAIVLLITVAKHFKLYERIRFLPLHQIIEKNCSAKPEVN